MKKQGRKLREKGGKKPGKEKRERERNDHLLHQTNKTKTNPSNYISWVCACWLVLPIFGLLDATGLLQRISLPAIGHCLGCVGWGSLHLFTNSTSCSILVLLQGWFGWPTSIWLWIPTVWVRLSSLIFELHPLYVGMVCWRSDSWLLLNAASYAAISSFVFCAFKSCLEFWL